MAGFEDPKNEEEEELVSDLLVAAKFATFKLVQQDPFEIDLDDVSPPVTKPLEFSSSSDEEESEEEEEVLASKSRMAVVDSDDDDDNDHAHSGGVSQFQYVPLSAPSQEMPEITLQDTVVLDALVITAIQPHSNILVVSSSNNKRNYVLDSGSVVCTSDRQVLGRIDDVFGPVDSPFYTVVITQQTMDNAQLHVEQKLGFVEKFASWVNCLTIVDAAPAIDLEDGDEALQEEDDSDVEATPRAVKPIKKNPQSKKVAMKRPRNITHQPVSLPPAAVAATTTGPVVSFPPPGWPAASVSAPVTSLPPGWPGTRPI